MNSAANQWILNVLQPLRKVLPNWPAVLPSRVGDPLRPLKIGIYDDLAALLGSPPSDAHEVLKRALRRFTSSSEYKSALAAEESWRYALDGTPVEPVSEKHRAYSRRGKTPRRAGEEVYVMPAQVKAFKVTIVLNPLTLKPVPPGAFVAIDVTTPEGLRARANVSPKSYRKAVEAIRERGAENIAVVLQGRMVRAGEIIDAGITLQERKAPAAEPAPVLAVAARPGRLTLKTGKGTGG